MPRGSAQSAGRSAFAGDHSGHRLLNGQELPVAYAGLTPGYIGLYQVNLAVPASTPPGLGISLTLKQGGVLSNTISVALQ